MLILTGQSAVAATLLSKAQQDVIAAQIAELRSNEEREMASSWSDAKKVAEFICRPLALQELRKWKKEADRVFLGTDDPSTLEMTSSQTLTGSGQVRVGSDWDDFTFTCRLDPDTGKALSFEVSH
ncbi:DUF930 domain-containing protein [Chelativorans sp.]|uniref:DUF930 domain-containing protein n=1 Tax=Chelativorans sp. TaxID=2203393 RepID=UPI002811FF23|nr:DUF930 domain-containing protein [Chelativorans sp.]